MSEDRKFPSSALRRGLAGMRHALGSRGRRFRNLAASDRAYTALIIRMAIAATLSYSISLLFFDPSGRDITAPMTTVLIMQGSLFATLLSGLRRVGGSADCQALDGSAISAGPRASSSLWPNRSADPLGGRSTTTPRRGAGRALAWCASLRTRGPHVVHR
jgi:hypothetical protein